MIRQQEYGAGEVVLAEGELGTGFCILESGSLEVIRDGKVISEIDMAGAIFGELSELLSLKRDAVIRAKTDSRVRHVEENIASICEKNPKVALKLMRTLGRRLYRMNRLAVRGDSQNDHLRSADELQEEDGGATGGIRILIVDDKPNIISQLKDIFSRSEWVCKSAHDEESAIAICNQSSFSSILISMALPDDAAVDLRRKLKTNHNVLNTPILGMIVKGDEAAQKKALDSGFADCITKPFDPNKTEAVMYNVMNLDSSARYFKFVEDYLYFKVPNELSNFVMNDIKENMESDTGERGAKRQRKMVDVRSRKPMRKKRKRLPPQNLPQKPRPNPRLPPRNRRQKPRRKPRSNAPCLQTLRGRTHDRLATHAS